MSDDLINFTEYEIKQLIELGLSPILFFCTITEDTYVHKLNRGYDLFEPYDYYDTEGESRTSISSLWIETFTELIETLKERMN